MRVRPFFSLANLERYCILDAARADRYATCGAQRENRRSLLGPRFPLPCPRVSSCRLREHPERRRQRRQRSHKVARCPGLLTRVCARAVGRWARAIRVPGHTGRRSCAPPARTNASGRAPEKRTVENRLNRIWTMLKVYSGVATHDGDLRPRLNSQQQARGSILSRPSRQRAKSCASRPRLRRARAADTPFDTP